MEKQVVYESRPRLLMLLIISWGFTLAGGWTHNWSGLVFFGLCAVVTTHPLLDRRKKLLFYGTPAFRAHVAQELAARQADPGDFTYFDGGFTLPSTTGLQSVAWRQVHAVFTYKQDYYSEDEVYLDVFCADGLSFTMREELAGWYVFVREAELHLPLPPDWFAEVTVPAFETKLTLLYDDQHRSFAQAVAHYYPDDTQPS